MAELDSETLREFRRFQTAQKLQQQAAATTASYGMGAVSRGEYAPVEQVSSVIAEPIKTPTSTLTPTPTPTPIPTPTSTPTPIPTPSVTLKTPEQIAAEEAAAQKTANRKSAYDLLYQQFNALGLASLVEPLKALIADAGVSPSEFAIKLQETDAYKKRFSANAQRIASGLRALSPAEYIGLEDQYQNIMRNYGMPESYYAKGELGKQAGFDKLIAGDVSAVELEDRLQTAYDKVINANPEISQALKSFYPEISDGDILAYAIDPKNALNEIKRKVTAAQIGGAALSAGLLGMTPEEVAKNLPGFGTRAKELAGFGITGEQYGAQSPFISSAAERGGQLASIYNQGAYGRTQAENEALNITGATEARKQRQKLTELEKSSFSGSSGTSSAIARDRAGAY